MLVVALVVLCWIASAASLNWTVSVTTRDQIPEHGIWSVCDKNSCKCGNNLANVVYCSGEDILIQPCYCMYYDQTENRTIVGNCMYTCFYVHSGNKGNYHYSVKHYSIDNATTFNTEVCGSLISYRDINREGRFCGRCKDGYGLAVYSYHYTRCVKCTDFGFKNWLRYFVVALLPLTLFYFLVVLFRINVSTSRLNGIVFVMQCIGSPLQLRTIEGYLSTLMYNNAFQFPKRARGLISVEILGCILGIVNLDFFRTIYPYFCLHPNMNILHVVSLDIIIALYPFILIFLTYILVTLYDRNCCLLVWAWRPFKWCLRHYQRQFNVKSSLIEAFATFILLCNVKVLGVCFDLLQSV